MTFVCLCTFFKLSLSLFCLLLFARCATRWKQLESDKHRQLANFDSYNFASYLFEWANQLACCCVCCLFNRSTIVCSHPRCTLSLFDDISLLATEESGGYARMLYIYIHENKSTKHIYFFISFCGCSMLYHYNHVDDLFLWLSKHKDTKLPPSQYGLYVLEVYLKLSPRGKLSLFLLLACSSNRAPSSRSVSCSTL